MENKKCLKPPTRKYVKISIIPEVIIKQQGFCSHCSGGKENWHRWLSMGELVTLGLRNPAPVGNYWDSYEILGQ